MAVNMQELKRIMDDKKITVEEMAAEMGIDKSTAYRKFSSGGGKITVSQAQRMARRLDLTGSEAAAIFFS